MGPLVSRRAVDRVCGYLESGQPEGRTAVTGGEPVGRTAATSSSRRCSSTRTDDMKVVREEIFGPVVIAIAVQGQSTSSVAEANNTVYGLAAGVWTRDIRKAHAIANSSAPARSGSTATTSSTPRCPSAATSSPAGAARWATTSSRPTPRSKPSPPSCKTAALAPGGRTTRSGPPGHLPGIAHMPVHTPVHQSTPARRPRRHTGVGPSAGLPADSWTGPDGLSDRDLTGRTGGR